jgi:hypothetical protein
VISSQRTAFSYQHSALSIQQRDLISNYLESQEHLNRSTRPLAAGKEITKLKCENCNVFALAFTMLLRVVDRRKMNLVKFLLLKAIALFGSEQIEPDIPNDGDSIP